MAEKVETPGQKEKGISVEKGRVRTKIFKYYEEGKYKQASNLHNEWNKKRPSNPMLFEQINMSAYMIWKIKKQIEAANP